MTRLKPVTLLLVVLLTGLLVFGWQRSAPAQSTSQLASRISRLESDNAQLRGQIARLESQVSQIGRSAGIAVPPPATPVPSSPSLGSPLLEDPAFERLATLVIELRERIIAVENRLQPG